MSGPGDFEIKPASLTRRSTRNHKYLVRSRHGGGLGQPVLGNVDEEVLQALREVHQVVLVVGAGETTVRAVGPLVRTVGGRLAGLGPGRG